jgi:hypothetical protein
MPHRFAEFAQRVLRRIEAVLGASKLVAAAADIGAVPATMKKGFGLRGMGCSSTRKISP